MKYLTLEQIVALHVYVVQQSGGSEGIRDLGRLESAIASQTQEVFGEELYIGIHAKAAAIARGIIGDHPFSDGNKRTAMMSAATLLQVNSYSLSASSQEFEDFAVAIATNHLDIPAIAAWFRQHSVERE